MVWIPCITSFITCEPASKVPVHPSAAIFQASGPRFTKNSETIAWLPGGKNCVRSAIKSNRLVLPPIRLVASPTAISRAGKKAKKRLNAIACEITPHRGKTRANIRYARRSNPAVEFIAGHYTCDGHSLSEVLHLRQLIRIGSKLGPLLHMNHREEFAVQQWNRDGFHGDIALNAEELRSRQRCSQLEASKPRRPRLRGKLGGDELRSLLPVDGVRRCALAGTMGGPLAGPGRL